MTALIYPFLALSAVGFGVMVVIHIASLFGDASWFEPWLKVLGFGVFIVFVPAVLLMTRLTRDFKQKDFWRAALRGCPSWMRRAVWIVFGYSWIGFFALPWLYGGGMDSAGNKDRVLSATLMTFYLIPLAVLYSATQVEKSDADRRCLNGHRMSPSAKFCEECGAPAAPSADVSHSQRV